MPSVIPIRLIAGEGRALVIGPDPAERLLEVVVLDDDPDEEPVIIPRDAPTRQVPQLPEVNPMPRTRAQLEQAVAETEAWLETLDPEALAPPDSDGEDLRAIAEALHAVATVDLALADKVAKARAHGRTWTQIAAVLGVTKQAARERFGEPAHH